MVVRKWLSLAHVPSVPDVDNYLRDQHGHLGYAPNPGDFFELPAGGVATTQLACNKGATKWWASSEGRTDIRQGDYPCPNYPTSQFHVSLFRISMSVAIANLGETECVFQLLFIFIQIDLTSDNFCSQRKFLRSTCFPAGGR